MKIIIGTPILLLIGMFGTIGLMEIGDEYIISNVSNITQTVATDSGVDSAYINNIQDAENNFRDTEMPFDLLLSMVLIGAFAFSLVSAYNAQPLPNYSFLGYSTIGIMVLLLVLVFLDQFLDYFINDFFYVLFDNADRNNAFLNWFFDNLTMISIIWFCILLFLNQVELNIRNLFSSGGSNTIEGKFEE
jgi:hypothetical protein